MEPTTYSVPLYEGLTQAALINWITDHSALPISARYMATVIAWTYYREGQQAFPSIEALADKMRMSVRNVNYLIANLRDSGEWIVVPGHGNRRNQERTVRDDIASNLYYPVIPADQLPDGVTLVSTLEIVVRERIARQPRVPTEVYAAEQDTSDHADEQDIAAYSAEDDAFVTAMYAEREPAAVPTSTPTAPEPVRQIAGSAMTAVELWVADAMPERVGELAHAPAPMRAAIGQAAEGVISGGHDIARVLSAAVEHSRSAISYLPAWLAKAALPRPTYWLGLESGRTNGVSTGTAETAEFLMHGLNEDLDYGVTGQEF